MVRFNASYISYLILGCPGLLSEGAGCPSGASSGSGISQGAPADQLAEALQPSGASRRRRPAAFRRRAPIFFACFRVYSRINQLSLSESRVAGGYPPLVRPEVQGNSDRHTRRHVRSAARVSTVCKPFAAAAHVVAPAAHAVTTPPPPPSPSPPPPTSAVMKSSRVW